MFKKANDNFINYVRKIYDNANNLSVQDIKMKCREIETKLIQLEGLHRNELKKEYRAGYRECMRIMEK